MTNENKPPIISDEELLKRYELDDITKLSYLTEEHKMILAKYENYKIYPNGIGGFMTMPIQNPLYPTKEMFGGPLSPK